MNLRLLSLVPFVLAALPAMAQTGPHMSDLGAGAAAPSDLATLPATIDLATVLRLAQSANPHVAAAQQDIAGAEADRISAGARPNPTVSFMGSNQPRELTNFEGPRAYDATVELPLLLGGKRSARITAANRRIDAARSRVATTQLEIMTDAGTAFITLLAAQEVAAVRQRALEELDRLRSVVAGRRSSGVASDYDLVRVDVEVESARADLADAESDVISAQADLTIALGLSNWTPKASGRLDAFTALSHGPHQSLDDLPNVAAAIAEERVAQADVVSARRERFPEVSLTGGHFWTTNPYGPTYSLGLSVEIPLFDRRNGPARRAEADARAAEFRTQIARAQAASEIDRYAAQVTTRTAALSTFNRQIGSKLPTLGQMAEDAYRLGGGSVIELIDATRSRFDSEVTRIDLSNKLAEAMLRLELARSGPSEQGTPAAQR